MSKTLTTKLMSHAMFAFVLMSSLVLVGCDKKAGPALPVPEVTVAKPLAQEVRSYEIFDGNVSPLLTVDLNARVPGYLTKILFEDGAYVKKTSCSLSLSKISMKSKSS